MTRIIFCLALWLSLGSTAALPALAERQDYVSGTGNSVGGFSGSYTDPDTGDRVTTIIAPRKSEQEQPWPPIYIYPQVTPQWPPTPGPNPGPNPGPIPNPDRPIAPLPPIPGRPVGPEIPPSSGGTVYPVPGSAWPSPLNPTKGR